MLNQAISLISWFIKHRSHDVEKIILRDGNYYKHDYLLFKLDEGRIYLLLSDDDITHKNFNKITLLIYERSTLLVGGDIQKYFEGFLARITKSKKQDLLAQAIEQRKANEKKALDLERKIRVAHGLVKDKIKPTILLRGENPVQLHNGEPYFEYGYMAQDVFGNDLTGSVVVTGEVDIRTNGTYTLTYTVEDGDGLLGVATREVIVGVENWVINN